MMNPNLNPWYKLNVKGITMAKVRGAMTFKGCNLMRFLSCLAIKSPIATTTGALATCGIDEASG